MTANSEAVIPGPATPPPPTPWQTISELDVPGPATPRWACLESPWNLDFTLVMGLPVQAAGGRPPRQVAQSDARVRDVTARASEFHRRIVEGMTCGVLTVDRAGVITTLNERARAALDLDDEEVLGLPCRDALGRCPRLAETLMESFTMASPPSRAETEIETRDHQRRVVGFSISMIAGDPGRPAEGAALFFRDLTRVEEQEERERLRDRLAVLGEMAAQMAHEIRNPLTSIEVSATLQKRRLAVKGEAVDLMDRITGEVARIEVSIANCLDYARPLSLELAMNDPASLVEEAITMAGYRAQSRGVIVERSIEPDLLPLFCDGPLLKEGIVNILLNAYEAMRGEGKITIGLVSAPARPLHEGRAERPHVLSGQTPVDGAHDRLLLIRIEDTGPGIPPGLRDRIFLPFFSTKTRGSGIGLAAARKVVEAHGGWLDVEGGIEHGAVFVIRLPLCAMRAAESRGGAA